MEHSLLLVEDDDTIRETILEALDQEGFRVTACANGRDALKVLRSDARQERPFALVLLDLMLPGLDGLELCRQLRQAGDSTPIQIGRAHV